ncbi:MAG: tetratricopeptide (TPR) repeat protein [Planctomycetota bacterium]|jgi:tetratricopeptide (TPR) repeat protein
MLNLNNLAVALLLSMLLSACQTGAPLKPVIPQAIESSVSTDTDLPKAASDDEPPASLALKPQHAPIETEVIDDERIGYQQAILALKNNEPRQAIKLLEPLAELSVEQPYILTNLGLAYFQLQDFERAEEFFELALGINDNDAVAHNHLGILQRHKGQFKNALDRYQRAIELDQNYAFAHLNLGILFDIYLQDLDKAMAQYELYLKLTSTENSEINGWILDIKRRLKSTASSTQG